jgi:hypothetical protein
MIWKCSDCGTDLKLNDYFYKNPTPIYFGREVNKIEKKFKEFVEWNKISKVGKNRYVWIHGGLADGVWVGLLGLIMNTNLPYYLYIIGFAIGSLIGYVFNLINWRNLEGKYSCGFNFGERNIT